MPQAFAVTDPGATSRKPVTTEHPQYAAMKAKWQRCRDAAGGVDALRKRAESYLPRLTDQSTQDYQAYFGRAVFFNATWRTISGLSGMLFRKPEQTEFSDALKALLDDVTLSNVPLHVFAHQLAIECFMVGRVGVLVDYPQAQAEQPLTLAQAKALNMRPTMARYCAETITNWRVEPINNVATLTMVTLTEQAQLPLGEFTQATELRYRVLDLAPQADGTRVYRVRIFRINDKDEQEQVGNDVIPLQNGKPLDSIPFVFFGVDDLTPEVDTPPLIDLVDLNLAHFRVSADYEHGCHFTALPTAVISGYQPTVQNERLYIGSTSAWVFPDPAAHASFLEFSGSGLGALLSNIAQKEEQMSALGARLLNADRRMNETATAAAIHHGGETSILAAIAQTLSLGLTRALNTFSTWAGLENTVKYQINRDFVPVPMDSTLLQSLVAAWQAGAISFDTLFQNLQEGEIIDAETTMDEELAAIKANPAPAPTAPAPAPTLSDGKPNPAAQPPEPKAVPNPNPTKEPA